MTLGLKRGTVQLVRHSAKWKKLFEREKKRLLLTFRGLVIDIQHIGSTAIPGIPAKPVIDMAVGVASMKKSKKCIKLLRTLGYEWREGVGGPNIRLFFARGPEHRRIYYLHLMKYNGELWKNALAFRNYLRNNQRAANQYAHLKKHLASRFEKDRKSYTASKAAFIHSIIHRARKK